ncbi:hypothetical protein [Deinococcus sp. QL22]|uniref:hypothetical protein n=1 Tax=Deinococcus sp. QL22 TaxID=2939437 RepID=UPI002017C9EC|nr:hypothetical protein [Deinococcus sp. QL22]UQN06114.1 hypothetical protein M1R55_14815 [Deinococcus sp. QL22]
MNVPSVAAGAAHACGTVTDGAVKAVGGMAARKPLRYLRATSPDLEAKRLIPYPYL